MKTRIKLSLIVILALAIIIPGYAKEAPAQTPEPQEDAAAFYKGKVITFIVPYTPGGGYDTYPRLIAPFLEKHTGATVIVKNMPGGGGLIAVNHLYNAAKRDGLTILTGPGPVIATNYLLQTEVTKFRAMEFNWLCRYATVTAVLWVGAKCPYKTLGDLRAAKVVKLGTQSRYAQQSFRTTLVIEGLGLDNVKVVGGYAGSRDIQLAVLRGEVDAECRAIDSVLPILTSGDGFALATIDRERDKNVPDVSTVYEIGIKNEKWMDWWLAADGLGRVIITTPGVPEARLKFLNDALKKTLQDKGLVDKAAKARRPIENVVFGDRFLELVKKTMNLSKAEIEELRHIVVEKYYK